MQHASKPLVLAAALALAAVPAYAQSWSYGVLTDTQGAGAYPDVSTRLMTPVVDQFVNAHAVDLIVSVGDLTDVGSNDEVDLWKQTAQPIFDAGIPFYAVRGNHDIKTEDVTIVDDPAFGPVGVNGTGLWDAQFPQFSNAGNPAVIDGPGASYVFAHENTTFIMTDLYGDTPTGIIGWITGVALPAAAASGSEHVVYVQHAPFFGKARPGVLAADTNLELQILGAMDQAGVDLALVGHDHQYSRGAALAPDGSVLLQHVVTGSASEKYYRNEEGLAVNEGGVAQINDRVGYSIVNVDGPLVAFTHYDSPAPDPQTTSPWTPDWRVADRFVYSTNGDQHFVPAEGTYAGLSSTSETGTTATLLGGQNSTFETRTTDPDPGNPSKTDSYGELVSLAWMDGADAPVLGEVLLLDGLGHQVTGTASDPYVLELTYDEADLAGVDESLLRLGFLDETTGLWVEAVTGNGSGVPDFVAGGWAGSLEVGLHGLDTGADAAWAVLDHNAPATRFGLIVIPEPSAVLPLALLGLAGLRRRSRSSHN
jgi:hypothetical protein